MIHFLYLTGIIIMYFAAFRVGQKTQREKDNKVIKEKDEKYETLRSEVFKIATSMDVETVNFNNAVRDRDELILQITQRNDYLEHIVKEMVLEPK